MCGTLCLATMKIQEQRVRFAGQLHRHRELIAHRLPLVGLGTGSWREEQGRYPGALSYVDNLQKEAGFNHTGGKN